jgi:hypothetical protein
MKMKYFDTQQGDAKCNIIKPHPPNSQNFCLSSSVLESWVLKVKGNIVVI